MAVEWGFSAYSHRFALEANDQLIPDKMTLDWMFQAITTGDIPGFIDVVLNFDSAALESDNLIYQHTTRGRSALFYGDDTWLKLFPESFTRFEGTTSFFVADYTEVGTDISVMNDSL